jgi:hypothetical protein
MLEHIWAIDPHWWNAEYSVGGILEQIYWRGVIIIFPGTRAILSAYTF